MTEDELDLELQRWSEQLRAEPAPAGLHRRILARLPARSDGDGLLGWITARLWRPALVAALPIVAGFCIGLAVPAPDHEALAEEVALLAFADYTELTDAQP